MKKFIHAILTLIIIFSSNIGLSILFNKPFIELSFLTGLLFVVIIWFFSSEGGFTTAMVDMPFKRFLEKDSRTNTHFVNFEINTPFIVSIVYTIIFGFISIFIYSKYF